jgi:hypothetical protein
MSLTVSPDLIVQAERGDVDDAAFVDCIASSLPYAWRLVTGLVAELSASGAGAQAAYEEFITARAQILNQQPELVDC